MSEVVFKLEIQHQPVDKKKEARRNALFHEMGLHPTRPYRLKEQPTIISFSGGASSGYMLWHLLEEFGGTLPDWIQVLFCNTGDELEETLEFVQNFTDKLGVKIHWLETNAEKTNLPGRLKLVDFDMAARKGEPFDGMLARKKFLPNVIRRVCTTDLKIKPKKMFAKHVLGWKEFSNVIGYRADESHRYYDMFECDKDGKYSRWDAGLAPQCPMIRAKVNKPMVNEFWARQSWRLELEPWEGNCVGCFLKGERILVATHRKRPGSLDRMNSREKIYKKKYPHKGSSISQFNKDRTFASIIRKADSQIDIDDIEDDQIQDCHCHN